MKKDVSVIGGSAAGFFSAYLLAREGHRVKLFESEEEIRPSSRTLIVTSRTTDLLGRLCEVPVINQIHRYELYTDGRVETVHLKRPDLVIERKNLIKQLSEKAESEGVQIWINHRFVNMKPNANRIHFNLSCNGRGAIIEKSAEVLVGADGAFSQVAKCGGWPEQSSIPLTQAIVKLPASMDPHSTKVWFIPEETPYFYWLIPYSKTHGVLGLISEEESYGQSLLEAFLARKNLDPIEFQSASAPKYTRWIPFHKRFGKNDVYLVGDAAGHVKVTTVGGVVTGFKGAAGIVEAIQNGKHSPLLKDLRRELDYHRLIRKVLYGFKQKDYSMLLALLNPPSKHLLSIFTRDEAGKLLFFLCLKQPRLLFLTLRTIVRSYGTSYNSFVKKKVNKL